MNTEITDIKKTKGWVCYDADCIFCVRVAGQFRGMLASRRLELMPLQAQRVREHLGLDEPALLAEMRLLKTDGRVFGGADALLEIAREFWWAWPLRQLGRVPAMRKLFRTGYRWVARQRSCAGSVCKTGVDAQRRRGLDFLPLLIFPVTALLCQTLLAPWVFMWAMAFALYAGCKWLTYRLATKNLRARSWALIWGYLLAWPGMDAGEFFNRDGEALKARRTEWALAVVKIIFGSILLWVITKMALHVHPLLGGWVGMIGIVFILHFGLFHVLSLAWRQAGVNAEPVMRNPLMAKSLADFWGARWNTAFNELAFRFTFRPLRRLTTPAVATLLVFGLSGIIHELVISLPAGGGYGLPTLYFLGQGLGVVAERSRWGRELGLGYGMRGWIFTLLVTAGPAFWLFHPPFINHVILPMLTAIGAT